MPPVTASRSAVSRPSSFPNKTGPIARRRLPPGGSRRAPAGGAPAARAGTSAVPKPDHEILFPQYFKSVGPRTYAAQVKRASNGNHYLVLTEGKRDDATGEVRKTRLFAYSEDFVEFFKLLQATAQFIRANPVPDDVKKRRDRFWARKAADATAKSNPDAPTRRPA